MTRPDEELSSRDIALGHSAIPFHAVGHGHCGTNSPFRVQKISVSPNRLFH